MQTITTGLSTTWVYDDCHASALSTEIFSSCEIYTDFDCARDCRNIESRKSIQSNEFRNRAEEKLRRKVIRAVIVQKGEKGKTRSFRSEIQDWKEKENVRGIIAKNFLLKKYVVVNGKSCDWTRNRESRDSKQKKYFPGLSSSRIAKAIYVSAIAKATAISVMMSSQQCT